MRQACTPSPVFYFVKGAGTEETCNFVWTLLRVIGIGSVIGVRNTGSEANESVAHSDVGHLIVARLIALVA